MNNIDFFSKETPVAAKQLSLSEDYKVFLVASEVDVYEEDDEQESELEEMGYMNATESFEMFKENIKSAQLPDGFRLVGMWIPGQKQSKKYGVVNLSSVGYK